MEKVKISRYSDLHYTPEEQAIVDEWTKNWQEGMDRKKKDRQGEVVSLVDIMKPAQVAYNIEMDRRLREASLYFTPSIEDIRQALINSNDTDLWEKVQLATLNYQPLIDKIKEICKKNTLSQK